VTLPAITFHPNCDEDALGTVLGRLTGTAFDFTLRDGDVVTGTLATVEYQHDGEIVLDVRDVDTERASLLRISSITGIQYC
jgi:hypothetical protein